MQLFRKLASWLGFVRAHDPSPHDGGFTVIKRPDGGTMLVDATTLAYLESNAPPPSQRVLEEALVRAVRARVYDVGVAGGKLLNLDGEPSPVLETSDPDDLTSLREALEIEEEPGGHCMCHGDHALEFLDDEGRVVALLGLHHGRSIRWEAWKDDAILREGMSVISWLAERGVTRPLELDEQQRREQVEYERARQRWEAATPTCLRGLVAEREGLDHPDAHEEKYEGHAESLAVVEAALAKAYEDEDERLVALLAWFGSGKGPWSGYPSYEGEPEQLLMRYPTPVLIRAFESVSDPVEEVLEGAARLFGGWTFSSRRERDRSLLSNALKRRLLEHVLPTQDEDKAGRAMSAFGSRS
ncbi:MAG: hypothetical protein M9894_03365 [Planctomycetes bacterium]|nr:hypothetical protein [Planctomycetota bacterium]